jgi:hypothetical protein
MAGFFVFGFALTMTPVFGPSSLRFPLSLISGRAVLIPSHDMGFGAARK